VSAQPDFTVTVTPPTRTVNPGDTTTFSVRLNAAQGGFGGNVQLGLASVPADASFSYDPQPAVLTVGGITTSTLTVSTAPRIAPDRYTLQVTAVASGVSKTFDIQLVVNPVGDFSVSADPAAIAVGVGTSRTVTIKLQVTGGFRSVITLEATPPPPGSGLSVSVQPNQLVPQSDTIGQVALVLTADRNAPARTFVVSVSARSGQLVHDVRVPVSIRQSAGCFIATAAYGSATAPQVQMLREYRDGPIQGSVVGQGFLWAFNSWYYSFSPHLAGVVGESELLRTTSASALYPLTIIIDSSSQIYAALAPQRELATVLAGIWTSLMVGLVYLSGPVAFAALFGRVHPAPHLRRALSPAAIAIVLSVGLLAVGELTRSTLGAGLGAALLVVSLMSASGALVYALIRRK